MTERIQESLLDNLLKSRYPHTYYLCRQQEFFDGFSTSQTTAVSNLSGLETNVIRKRKTMPPSCYSISEAADPQASNGISSDHEVNTASDQNSENDDEATQEYDEIPLLKSINEKNVVKQ